MSESITREEFAKSEERASHARQTIYDKLDGIHRDINNLNLRLTEESGRGDMRTANIAAITKLIESLQTRVEKMATSDEVEDLKKKSRTLKNGSGARLFGPYSFPAVALWVSRKLSGF